MERVDILIVGAGFAGLRALHTFRAQGSSVVVLEASDGVGGVWRHNGYPGARCDVESYDYSYSFSPELEQEWRWSERYATQPEILRYIEHVADRFDLRRDIRFDTRMESAVYDEGQPLDRDRERRPRLVRRSSRPLHGAALDAEKPELSRSGKLPGSHPAQRTVAEGACRLQGQARRHHRHGIVGMQMTPVVARDAAHLVVFQRTANYSIPAANAPVTEEEDREVKANYAARREQARNSPTGLGFRQNRVSALDATPEEREKVYEAAWNRLGFGFALAYYDILLSKPANDTPQSSSGARSPRRWRTPSCARS